MSIPPLKRAMLLKDYLCQDGTILQLEGCCPTFTTAESELNSRIAIIKHVHLTKRPPSDCLFASDLCYGSVNIARPLPHLALSSVLFFVALCHCHPASLSFPLSLLRPLYVVFAQIHCERPRPPRPHPIPNSHLF